MRSLCSRLCIQQNVYPLPSHTRLTQSILPAPGWLPSRHKQPSHHVRAANASRPQPGTPPSAVSAHPPRSEEHTSELQSRQYLVCRLLLEKKNNEPSIPCMI